MTRRKVRRSAGDNSTINSMSQEIMRKAKRLDAFLQDEKNTQEKVKKAQAEQHQRRKTDKEW